MCKNSIEKLPFVLKYVLDQCEIDEIWGKVILENGGMLHFLTVTRIKKYVLKLFMIMFMHQNLYPIAIKLK